MTTTSVRRIAWSTIAPTCLCRDSAIAADWDRLNAARLDLPFLCAEAIAAALATLGQGNERLLIGRRGTDTVAMFILVPQGRGRWTTFQPSQLPLGAWVAEAGIDLTELTASLLQGPLLLALVLSITAVDPLSHARGPVLPQQRWSGCIETAWIDIAGSFADYWAARGKNLRQNLRKQRNKLAAEGVRTDMRVWARPDDMAPALGRYGEMESAGWKAGVGTSVAAGNAQGRYYTALLEDAARRGEARVYEYLFDDRSVAMNLCLLRRGVLSVLKTTYDESSRLYSPASLLREEELQRFFAEGEVRRIEYYGQVMDWHTKLTDCKRELHHLTVFRWAFVKRLADRQQAARDMQPVQAVPEAHTASPPSPPQPAHGAAR